MSVWKRVTGILGRGKETATVSQIIDLMNRGAPLLNVSRDLYNIPEVRTTINFIAEKVSSVPFYHVRSDFEGNIAIVPGSVQRVLTIRPNPYQSPQVFWTYAITRLLLSNNVFIMPEWDDRGQLQALYVMPFTRFEFDKDEDGRAVITFPYEKRYSCYYDDIIHLQRFPTEKGGSSRHATSGYVEIVGTMQNQAVEDSKNSQRIAALLQAKTALKSTDMKKKLDEFKDLFLTSENTTGFGMIGAEYEVHKLDMKLSPLNREVMEAIIGYLYNYFGASKEIITHTATELVYEQFIDNTIKPIVYQIEEELTYKLFSSTEVGHNNRISAELIDLEISTLSAKTAFFKEMLFGGVLNRNDVRRRLSFPKGPPELDQYMESKNFMAIGQNAIVGGGDNLEQNGTGKEVPAGE
ncbi:phage portal protein [Paenibacillus gansuensis]|uniref:Phage portal protein n=1 Tax=Paenibacillus gansuensis TaxID=306542 RepID=A0ABW5PIL6_9BACL